MAMEPSENIDPTLGEGVFIAASADVSADVIGRVKLGEAGERLVKCDAA